MKRVVIVLSSMLAAAVALICVMLFVDFSGGEQSLYFSGIVVQLFKYRITDTSAELQNVTSSLAYLLCVVAAYLLGSINFALFVSKNLHNQDIRRFGSKNAGMTNMMRVYGKRSGLLTLAGDALKSALAIFVGRLLCGEEGAYIAALMCILGHVAPIYYRFKGGKGVVSSAIAIFLIDWQIFLVLLAVFALVFFASRIVSLSSVLTAFLYPGVVWMASIVRYGEDAAVSLSAMMFSLFIGFFIIFTHRENLKRFYYGEEKRISFKKKGED